MRCRRCGRRGRIQRASRIPSGRLVFDWCVGCLHEVGLESLGLPVHRRVKSKRRPKVLGIPSEYQRAIRLRSSGLVALSLAFAVWGLIVVLAGTSFAFSTNPLGLTSEPSRIIRSRLLIYGGAIAASISVGSALMVLRKERRRIIALQAIEYASWSFAVSSFVLIQTRNLEGWTVGNVTSLAAGLLLGAAARTVEGRISLDDKEAEQGKGDGANFSQAVIPPPKY